MGSSQRRRNFAGMKLRRLRREYIEERKPNLAKLLEKDLHNDNWALKKNRLNSDESLSEEPYYTQPKMFTSCSMRVYSGKRFSIHQRHRRRLYHPEGRKSH
jgi:hypothetical protein